jgi:hypothetical protein
VFIYSRPANNHRLLTADEYAPGGWMMLTLAWLGRWYLTIINHHLQLLVACPPQLACTAYAGVMLPCFRGSLVQQFADGQAELEFLPEASLP